MTEYEYSPTEYPASCPKCGSLDMTMFDHSFYGATEAKDYGCNVCGFAWTEVWKFHSWEPAEEDN